MRGTFHAAENVTVLGMYEPGAAFPGTDRLSMALAPLLVGWLGACRARVFCEGQRVLVKPVLDAFGARGARLILVEASRAVLEARHTKRTQSAAFRSRQASAVRNALGNRAHDTVTNDTDEDAELIAAGVLASLTGRALSW